NNDGSIDFREYVIGLAVLCNPANTEEIIQVAFKEDNVIKSIATENKENTGIHFNNSGSRLGVSIETEEQLFDVDEDGYITEEEFCTILQASLGVPDLDVSGLFREIAQGDSVSYEEFKSFALKHPEYAKIFTTYLDLQTCHVFSLPDEVQTARSVASNKVSPENHEEGISDKKDTMGLEAHRLGKWSLLPNIVAPEDSKKVPLSTSQGPFQGFLWEMTKDGLTAPAIALHPMACVTKCHGKWK
ncbi:hypothetical protein A6R68_15626, partial [Neotoma lepida]